MDKLFANIKSDWQLVIKARWYAKPVAFIGFLFFVVVNVILDLIEAVLSLNRTAKEKILAAYPRARCIRYRYRGDGG